jgi:hypothetical protein
VKLRVEREGVSAETAAAVPVGWSETRLYFVTAYHGVGPVRTGQVEHAVTSIRVGWFNDPELRDAVLFDRYDPVLDLAVVSTALPQGFVREPALRDRAPKAGEAVTLIGHPAAGDWGVWTGRVQNENASGTDVAHFVYTSTGNPTDGFSGGAVIGSDDAFLGIHSATPSPAYALGIKSVDIMRLLGVWRVPMNRFSTDAGGGGSSASVVADLKRALEGTGKTEWYLPPAQTGLGDQITHASERREVSKLEACHLYLHVSSEWEGDSLPRIGGELEMDLNIDLTDLHAEIGQWVGHPSAFNTYIPRQTKYPLVRSAPNAGPPGASYKLGAFVVKISAGIAGFKPIAMRLSEHAFASDDVSRSETWFNGWNFLYEYEQGATIGLAAINRAIDGCRGTAR